MGIFNFFKKKSTTKDKSGPKNKYILIIDDNQVDRTFIVKSLAKNTYLTTEAINGEDGLKIARLERPDLIILDCKLPGISGIEVCKILKNDIKTKHIPLIVLTSDQSNLNMLKCYENGADDYLTKPIYSKLLFAHVEVALENK